MVKTGTVLPVYPPVDSYAIRTVATRSAKTTPTPILFNDNNNLASYSYNFHNVAAEEPKRVSFGATDMYKYYNRSNESNNNNNNNNNNIRSSMDENGHREDSALKPAWTTTTPTESAAKRIDYNTFQTRLKVSEFQAKELATRKRTEKEDPEVYELEFKQDCDLQMQNILQLQQSASTDLLLLSAQEKERVAAVIDTLRSIYSMIASDQLLPASSSSSVSSSSPRSIVTAFEEDDDFYECD
jgi:hypothetical protein